LSDEEFLGRVINPGLQSYYFELCDVCEKRSPNWIETNQIGNVSEVRVSCNECHSDYLNKLGIPQESASEAEFEIYNEVPAENEDITPVERPAWMQDFIDEAEKDGAIETIGGSEEAASNIEILGDIDDETPSTDTLSSEASTDQESIDILSTTEEGIQTLVAAWSGEFIKEALFGEDPVSWLDEQGAFNPENLNSTIYTLTKLSENQVTNVKISAIHCLNSIAGKNPNLKAEIISSLNNFTTDMDEMVSSYAQDTINSLK
jgi:hypothetical protein